MSYHMTKEEFHEFMVEQAEAIKAYKWIESEKVGYDIGLNACNEWIKKFAKQFREEWIKKHQKEER